jgi:hypothetical protein
VRRGVPTLLLLAVVAGCSARPPARSLTDLQQQIRPGHTVYVIDTSGTETRGKLTAITPTGLTVDVSGASRTFDEPQIRQVQRYGDSLRNGALIGAGIALPGALIGDLSYTCREGGVDGRCGFGVGRRALTVGLFAAVGAGIDALMRSRRQVFLAPGTTTATRRLRVAPDLLRKGGGVALMIEY